MFKKLWRKLGRFRYGIASMCFWGSLGLLGYTNQTLGYLLLAISVLLFFSPAIEMARGVRLQIDPHPGVPKKRKQIFQLDQPFSHGLMIVSIVLVIATFLTRPRTLIVNAKAVATSSKTTPELISVVRQRFDNTTVPLDGHQYFECTFKNVIFRWDGAPFSVINAHMETPVGSLTGVESTNPTIENTIALLQNLNLTKDLHSASVPLK